MANRDILAIGTSAGGVEALLFLAKNFPPEFPAAVCITIHLPSQFPSSLDQVLTRAGRLPAEFARHGETIHKGRIYLAPVDRHLIIEDDRIVLGRGSRENNARPAIDPMLRSVAACCGPRTIGVVLTGTLTDGASGLWALDQCGGVTVVQDPEDAAFPDMPLNALNRLRPDHVVSLASLPSLLAKLTSQPAGNPMPVPESVSFEIEIAKGAYSTANEMDQIGRRSTFACPDCHGTMWEIDEGQLVRYRCHVGHTYTAELMSVALDENLRRVLGNSLRALEERRALAAKLEAEAKASGQKFLAASWGEQARNCEAELKILRESIERINRIAAKSVSKSAAE